MTEESHLVKREGKWITVDDVVDDTMTMADYNNLVIVPTVLDE